MSGCASRGGAAGATHRFTTRRGGSCSPASGHFFSTWSRHRERAGSPGVASRVARSCAGPRIWAWPPRRWAARAARATSAARRGSRRRAAGNPVRDRPLHPAGRSSVEGVPVRPGPVYTTFATFALTRTPTPADQATLARALATIEAGLPVQPRGGLHDRLLRHPLLRTAARRHGRAAGRRAHAAAARRTGRVTCSRRRCPARPTSPRPIPEVSKLRFNVPVQIEANDMLLVAAQRLHRGDRRRRRAGWSAKARRWPARASGNRDSAGCWRSPRRRLMFNQPGLPRAVAEEQQLPYAETINPNSSMWMGFSDAQVGSSGPPPITTFLGIRVGEADDGAAPATTSPAARSCTSLT